MTGTVFDIGYQRYNGPREGRGRGRAAIVRSGVRMALGFGRGARAMVLPWMFIAVLAGIAFIFALIAGAADYAGGAGTAEQMNLPSHADYYGGASVIIFLFAALVGPELLCRDRREGVIQLYLVRPVTGTDYIVSRWAACFLVISAAAWLPQFVIFVGLAAGNPAPVEYVRQHWTDIPRFLLAGLALAAYASTLALLTASFTTRRAYASVFLVGLLVITTPFTVGLAQEVGGTAGAWISMFNLATIPVHVNDLIFATTAEITSELPAHTLPPRVKIGWYLLWTVGPGLLLWSRYRRLTP